MFEFQQDKSDKRNISHPPAFGNSDFDLFKYIAELIYCGKLAGNIREYPGRGGRNLDQTGMCHWRLKFITLFWTENPKSIPCFGVTTSSLYCIVLYCIVLYCIVLYCIVLYCIVLYCIVLYCIGDKDHIYALLNI